MMVSVWQSIVRLHGSLFPAAVSNFRQGIARSSDRLMLKCVSVELLIVTGFSLSQSEAYTALDSDTGGEGLWVQTGLDGHKTGN